MDLSTLDVSEAASRGADLHLRHPATDELLFSDDGDAVIIHLLGSDSDEYRQQLRRTANRKINQRNAKQSVEKLEQEGIELLAAVTTGWDNMVEDGEPLEFSPDAAKDLYRRYPWVREQVDAFVSERTNFLNSA